MEHEGSLPRAEGTTELERSGAADSATAGQQASVRSRISNAMVGMKKDFYGKGPEKAKTFINDEYVFVVLEGGLTRNEETLLAAGAHDLVRNYRLRFQEAMTETATKAVEDIVGRKVVAYHSQIVFDPARAFEIFVLDG